VVNYKEREPNVTLSLRQADILTALAQDDKLCHDGGCVPELQDVGCVPASSLLWFLLMVCRGSLPIFHPEFGRFMLEATPGQPWGIGFKDLLDVEKDMKLR
jgi:glutamate--cysteine ligase catalytic subunit